MPRISFVVTLEQDGLAAQMALQSVCAQDGGSYELVVVCKSGCAATEDLSASTIVECSGNIAQMRDAGLQAATGEYCIFLTQDMRVVTNLSKVVCAKLDIMEKDLPDIVMLHMRVKNTATQQFVTQRIPAKRSEVAPAPAINRADDLLQHFTPNLGGMLISRTYLLKLRQGFSSLYSLDDEPLAMLALMHCERVSNFAWSLIEADVDICERTQNAQLDELTQRLDCALNVVELLEGDLERYRRTYLQWIASFFACLAQEQPEDVLSALSARALPTVQKLRTDEMSFSNWRDFRLIELGAASRMQLLEEVLHNEEQALENKYALACEQIRVAKLLERVGTSTASSQEKRKHKGFFRK